MLNQSLRSVRFPPSPANKPNKNKGEHRKSSYRGHTVGILLLIFMVSCGGGGGDASIHYDGPVQGITIKGDSMAAGVSMSGLVTTWWYVLPGTWENDGLSGYPVDALPLDARHLNSVIVFAGFNNLKHSSQTAEYVLGLYSAYLATLHSDNIICIGVPFVDERAYAAIPDLQLDMNIKIAAFNEGLKSKCKFIDTSDVPTVDGIHPVYDKIIERLCNPLVLLKCT